ncbi:MAG: 4'-phosphopantetheinyl transferase superfamily protein [Acidobacteriota bacterium]
MPPNEVHIWRVPLDRSEGELGELLSLLDADERTRASSFHFERDRLHFTAARGLLRIALGRYLGLHPSLVAFRYSSHGKPSLDGDAGERVRFNISHSHGLALFAFTLERAVGIDLEMIRPGPADETIAENYFTPAEVDSLRSLPRDERDRGFFNCWTRKEAYLKARGDGLSLPLDHFEVTLAPHEPVRVRHIVEATRDERNWKLVSLSAGDGFVAALVVEGDDWEARWWSL